MPHRFSKSLFFFIRLICWVHGTVHPQFIYNTEIYWNAYRCVAGAGEQLATDRGQSGDSRFYVTVILLACIILKIIIKMYYPYILQHYIIIEVIPSRTKYLL
jgi:hypothetical protein